MPALLVSAWLLARATATLMYDEVWVAAREGVGVFQPMRAWYDHYGETTALCLAGLVHAAACATDKNPLGLAWRVFSFQRR